MLAEMSSGFSFAYLKELVVTSLMRTVAGDGPWVAVVKRECATLAADMKTTHIITPPNVPADVDDGGDD